MNDAMKFFIISLLIIMITAIAIIMVNLNPARLVDIKEDQLIKEVDKYFNNTIKDFAKYYSMNIGYWERRKIKVFVMVIEEMKESVIKIIKGEPNETNKN